MINGSRRWSPSIRRHKVYKQIEKSGRNSGCTGMVLTVKTFCGLCRYKMCEGGGPGFRPVGAEMTGEER
jgi:hypothetical protein